MKIKMKAVSAAALLLLSIGLSACSEKIPPEETVKQRALARWEIRKAGKIEGLYEFLSPAQRQVLSRSAYERAFGDRVEYLNVKVNEINCPGEKPTNCEVKLLVTAKLRGKGFPSADNQVIETWVLEDDQWWLVSK
ncbi:MAG: hypothetical protein CR977_00190 [Gammaproteobacteria bacterium]|nr:MAG: hypothetical protein CR977_00190 [Gammaproteobacteria bacterium]